jgi:predicted DNA binding protein
MSINRLLIDVELPEGNWAKDITMRYPDILIQVEERMIMSDDNTALRLSIQGSNTSKALGLLVKHPQVYHHTIYSSCEKNIEVSLLLNGQNMIQKPLIKSGMIVQTPYLIRNGHTSWSFATDRDGALQIKKTLDDSYLKYQIIAFGAQQEKPLLTPRQREIFDEAVYNGYYDKPRRITLTKLAGEMKISKSAMCEIVHLIERNIMHNFANEVRMMSPMG